MDDDNVLVRTPVCIICGRDGEVRMPRLGFAAWMSGALAQDALRDMPADLREQAISGTHPACWDTLGDDED